MERIIANERFKREQHDKKKEIKNRMRKGEEISEEDINNNFPVKRFECHDVLGDSSKQCPICYQEELQIKKNPNMSPELIREAIRNKVKQTIGKNQIIFY